MRNFKANAETNARKKKWTIPPELEAAHFIVNGISLWEYRSYPKHILEEIKLYWHLQTVNNEANQPKMPKGKTS